MPTAARAADPCTTAAIDAAGFAHSSMLDEHTPSWTDAQRARVVAGGSVVFAEADDVPALALVASTAGIIAVALLIFGGCALLGFAVAHFIDAMVG